jgi:hypothetical protein
MPPKSQAQRERMQRAAKGGDPQIPASVAKEFLASDTGGKLPERLGPKRTPGGVSGKRRRRKR